MPCAAARKLPQPLQTEEPSGLIPTYLAPLSCSTVAAAWHSCGTVARQGRSAARPVHPHQKIQQDACKPSATIRAARQQVAGGSWSLLMHIWQAWARFPQGHEDDPHSYCGRIRPSKACTLALEKTGTEGSAPAARPSEMHSMAQGFNVPEEWQGRTLPAAVPGGRRRERHLFGNALCDRGCSNVVVLGAGCASRPVYRAADKRRHSRSCSTLRCW